MQVGEGLGGIAMLSVKMNQVSLSGAGMQEVLLWLLFYSALETFGRNRFHRGFRLHRDWRNSLVGEMLCCVSMAT